MDTRAKRLRDQVGKVRRFNRFYTPLIGLLEESFLESPFSLTQVRILYELRNSGGTTAAQLARTLLLDPGYLSRILRGFTEVGLVEQRRSERDRRQRLLSLTAQGRRIFDPLDQRSHDEVAALLERLPADERQRLVAAMAVIEKVLGERDEGREPYVLRGPAPGDMGWVVERHGALYADEYGWDETFEGLVAEIVGGFARRHDPRRERCWIAELDGENVGSVFCVRKSDEVAQLRLLLVEPRARGLGIGRRLVHECIRFARRARYRTLMLWTNDVLVAARGIYEEAGFRLVEEERHHSFGHDLVGQNWELELPGEYRSAKT